MASARSIRAGAAYVELFVNDSKLVRGLQNASRKLKAFGEAVTGWGQKLAGIGAAIVTPLIASAKLFSELGDQMSKMSQRTGISVETLSELAYAAQLSGTDVETLEGGLRKMQKTVAAAAEGSKAAAAALAEVGLSVADLQGLSPDEQFKLIADRLSQIQSPAIKAAAALAIFGRAGTALIPLMSNGAQGIEDLQAQARALGLTISTEDADAAAALNDAFDTLWKTLRQGVFVIGSALAPLLKSVSEWVTRVVVGTTAWIKQNKDLVVTVFEVAAGVLAGGLALIGLGAAFTAAGTLLGAFAGIVAGVGTALGILGGILAWLVTPIGLAVAAVVALGSYLIYVSGAGGKALRWLGERFGELAGFASDSFKGISDALVAGDITLAAKILWLSLKILWQRGVLELTKLWESLKEGANKAVWSLWFGVEAAWEIGTSAISKTMLKAYYFIRGVWEKLSTGIMNLWDAAINWTSKRIVDLQGVVDETLDTDAIKQGLDEDLQNSVAEREKQKDENLQQIDAERDTALKQAQQDSDAKLAEIGQAAVDREGQLDSDAQKKIDQSQADLDAAKAEWQKAIADARQEREIKDGQAPPPLTPPQELPDLLEGLGPTLEAAQQQTIGVAGSFNALEARGLGAGGVTDRIAKAAEDTAKNTKQLVQEAQWGGMEFD